MNVQLAHTAPLKAKGVLRVVHGTHRFNKLLVKLMKLPPAGPGQAAELELTYSAEEMHWSRRIGGRPLRTVQSARNGFLVEKSGIGSVKFHLMEQDGSLAYRQKSMTCCGIPIPKFLAPRVQGKVSPESNGWRVEVTVTWRGHFVCRYEGKMRAR